MLSTHYLSCLIRADFGGHLHINIMSYAHRHLPSSYCSYLRIFSYAIILATKFLGCESTKKFLLVIVSSSGVVSICIQHRLFVSEVLYIAIITSCEVIQPLILYSGILSLQETGFAHTAMKYPSLHTGCYTFQMNSLNY